MARGKRIRTAGGNIRIVRTRQGIITLDPKGNVIRVKSL